MKFKLSDPETLCTAQSSGSYTLSCSDSAVAVALMCQFSVGASGSVLIEGSLDDSVYGTLASVTAEASTNIPVHLVDLPVKTLRVTPSLGAGTVTIKAARGHG